MSAKKYDDVSIYYDEPRKRYIAKITVEKGKPRKTVYGKTEEETLFNARKLLYGTRDEKFIVSKGMPLVELLKYNLERRDSAGKVGDAQYVRTTYIIKYVEKSEIGNKNIRDITEKDFQDFFNKISKKYADSSIGKYYTEINQALKYAKKKKIIEENVLEDILRPKSSKDEKEVIPLTTEEQKTLTEYLKSVHLSDYKHRNALLIQLYMGLRIGEALALQKNDIDLQKRTIHIQRTLTQNRKKEIIIGKVPKTSAGNRVLPIPDIIFDFVKEQLELSKGNRDDLLFVNDDKLVRHTCINDQLKRRLVKLGIYNEGITTHSLRHTYATRCIESGMQPIVLSKLLGHSDIRITLNTYVKIFNQYQTEKSKEVEEYYKNINLYNTEPQLDNCDTVQEEHTPTKSNIIQFPKRAINDYYR